MRMTQSRGRFVVAAGIATIGLVALACVAGRAESDDSRNQPGYAIRLIESVMVPMRDGVHLSTDLYLPDGAAGEFPAILIRTVYSKDTAYDWYAGEGQSNFVPTMVAKGYAVAIQDMRGRHQSEGQYKPSIGDRNDGYDTVTWLTEQGWSNGKVGSFGCSYLGDVQLLLAATRQPNHLTAVPMAPSTGYYAHGRPWVSYDGGAFELAQTAGWFSSSGNKFFYGPPPGVDRQKWFRSKASKQCRMAPERGESEHAPFLSTLPTIDIVKKSGAAPTDYEDFASNNP